MHVENIISQSEFLQKMGIIERFKIASKTMNLNEKSDLYLRIKRLIDPEMMGKNFKVILQKMQNVTSLWLLNNVLFKKSKKIIL